MTCSYCEAANLTEAVFCASCGEPFYRAEKWSLPFYHYDESRGDVKVKLRFRNAGVGALYPRALVSLNGSFEMQLPSGAGIDVTSWRDFMIERHTFDGPKGTFHDLACRCELQYDGSRTLLIPVPTLRIGPQPDVRLNVGISHKDDLYVLNAESTVVKGHTDDEDTLSLPLRPSGQFRIKGHVNVLNDTTTRIRSISLDTDDGRNVVRYDGEGRTATVFELYLTPEKHQDLKEPDAYILSVDVDGVDVPITLRFRPVFHRVPTLQVLVERPTKAGWAFVGLEDQVKDDVSPKRIAGESGARPLHETRVRALETDDLVQRTFDGLREATPEIVWRVPNGVARTKRIAIDRVSGPGDGRTRPDDEQLSFHVTVSLGDHEERHGPFRIQGRSYVPVPIPALNDDTTGQLQIHWEGQSTLALDVKCRVEVTPREVFPLPIAIDFGTTNSCVALSLPERNARGRLIPNAGLDTTFLVPVGRLHADDGADSIRSVQTSAILPTRVYKTEDGSLHVDEAHDKDAPVFRSFKTNLEAPFVIAEEKENDRNNTDPPKHAPKALTRAFLEHVLERTLAFLEERGLPAVPEEIICTLPTTFSQAELHAILDVYQSLQEQQKADSARRIKMDESMAAFFFQRKHGLEERFIEYKETGVMLLVYDFGGGTTDVTALYAYWQTSSGGGGRWRYVELAAGGNPNLGGDDVTRDLGKKLFGRVPVGEGKDRIDVAMVEEIKHNLGRLDSLNEIRQERVRKRIGVLRQDGDRQSDQSDGDSPVLASEEEAVEHARNAHQDILKDLGAKGRAVLEDVFRKAFARLRAMEDVDAPRELPIFCMLAGNAARLDGFTDTIAESAQAALRACSDARGTQIVHLDLVNEPKASVSKGAYLSKGNPPDADMRFRPYVSYWLELPADAMPADSMTSFVNDDGHTCVQIIGEGTKPPYEVNLPADAVGVFEEGTYPIHERRGVELTLLERLRLGVPSSNGAVLNVRYDDDGVSIDVREAASS